MPAKKNTRASRPKAQPSSPDASSLRIGSTLSTVSGPSTNPPSPEPHAVPMAPGAKALETKQNADEQFASALPANLIKPSEFATVNKHGRTEGAPDEGVTVDPPAPIAGASTVMEGLASPKLGTGVATPGVNAGNAPLDRARIDSTGRPMTTNQGVPVSDNQNSLKAGLRGPTLLEDFILREKITHFDHERIPERVVHARGSAAHGYFECTADITKITMAAPFAQVGKRTPTFVRFSTVAGERGSADTVRDVRGFAVKFYTDEGNWDLVGNNIPVFFIQDAMKFPDLVHAVKPEPHHAMPQASSAHDTFWDFVSLMPESTHMLLWQMSDRAIPRSYRTMQGFGVHTFRLVNAAGESVFCKFHWQPVLGTHSLAWDEAVKIAGCDGDFHRRDLWEAIDAGVFPEWELGLQVFTEAQADTFAFDVLDATKLVPEELVPVVVVGRLVLNRNPDNFFAETEQVAFCTAHVIPGIDFSNDPLLAGRLHSYQDTQISRLGGANFHEIPINASVAQAHNNTRDGHHRQGINRGRVAYEPNSLAGGCPFQAGMNGFRSFPQPVAEDKVRGKPEKFADHYSQAKLFFASQSPIEQAHIINAFRFELTRVQTNAVRERVVSMLANVDDALAAGVAAGLGIEVPEPMPLVLEMKKTGPQTPSPALSLFSRPGAGGVKTRRVALMIADGVNAASLLEAHKALAAEGAIPRFVAPRLGAFKSADGQVLHAEASFDTMPGVLFDAVVVPDGAAAVKMLSALPSAIDFIRDQHRHCKAIMVLGAGGAFLAAAGLPTTLPSGGEDKALISGNGTKDANSVDRFINAISLHRNWDREPLPPA